MCDCLPPSTYMERVIFRSNLRNRTATGLHDSVNGFHFPAACAPSSTVSGADKIVMEYVERGVDWRDFGFQGDGPLRKVLVR